MLEAKQYCNPGPLHLYEYCILAPGPEPSLHPLSGIPPLLDSTASWLLSLGFYEVSSIKDNQDKRKRN